MTTGVNDVSDKELELLDGEEQPDDEAEAEETAAEGEEPAGDKDQPTEAKPEGENPEVKRWRDAANERGGHLNLTLKGLKAMQEKTGFTDDELAEALGRPVADVQAILNQEPLPDDPLQANAQKLLNQIGTKDKPSDTKVLLDETYGEDTGPYFEAFGELLTLDPEERRKFAEQEPRKLVSYAAKRGKEFAEELADIKKHGGALAALRAIKKSKAEAQPDPEETEELTPKQRIPLNGGSNAPAKSAPVGDLTSTILG
jgi:hypothetical protein